MAGAGPGEGAGAGAGAGAGDGAGDGAGAGDGVTDWGTSGTCRLRSPITAIGSPIGTDVPGWTRTA